jgi:hypothetical protein
MRRLLPWAGLALTLVALFAVTGALAGRPAGAHPVATGRIAAPGGAPTPTSTPPACTVTQVLTGTLTNTDLSTTTRLFRDDPATTCAAPTTCSTTGAGTFYYDLYPFSNDSDNAACIMVTLGSTSCVGSPFLFSGAYLTSFDPNNLCANFAGDLGHSPDATGPLSYSFSVPAHTTFYVNVQAVTSGATCGDYTLTVQNIPCGLTTPTATATDTPVPTATATNTAVPTETATAVPTDTTVPVTATSTAAPPTATSTPVNCPLPFTDVDQFNPFYQYIQCLYCRGIISGYADNTFRWGNDVTRGQVSKIIANSAGLNATVSGQTFTDVPPANPFYVYIERLAATGAISGYDTAANCPTGTPCFRWELPVTRGQLAKIDANAAGYNETPTGQTFADVPAANPFYVFIERLSLHGVISGYTCGGPGEPCPGIYYRPFNNITRGQVSKVAAQTFFPMNCAPAR